MVKEVMKSKSSVAVLLVPPERIDDVVVLLVPLDCESRNACEKKEKSRSREDEPAVGMRAWMLCLLDDVESVLP